jgi:myo-inositol 2-dehydrogenase/D-chiro-inositol 1-dehydrogenase
MSTTTVNTGPKPLRIGIAGLGRLGMRHAENLAFRVRHCQLVAACSPIQAERDAARTQLGVTQVFDSLEAMLQGADLDAVVLVTPTSLHAEQAITVLQAGKHVFIEKPLALNVEDCERVEAVQAQHPQQIAMVGFVRRFDPSYASAFESIQADAVGKPFLVRSQTADQHSPDGFFVRFAGTSGGIFMDCSVHDIDLARWMLGGPKALRAFATGTNACHPDLAQHQDVDNGLAIVEFEGGARAVLYASRTFAHGHETQTEVIGTRGQLQVGHGAARDRVVFSDQHGVRHLAVKDFFERFEAAFLLEMQAFVDACHGTRPAPLSLNDATEATRIGLAITQSLRSGQPEAV